MTRPGPALSVAVVVVAATAVAAAFAPRSHAAHSAAPVAAVAAVAPPPAAPERPRARQSAAAAFAEYQAPSGGSATSSVAGEGTSVRFDSTGAPILPAAYAAYNALGLMRMKLREVGMGEENASVEYGAYTADLAKLMLPRRTGDLAEVRILYAGPTGWAAEATHPTLPGKSCVTYDGPPTAVPFVPSTKLEGKRPLGPRDMVCDGPTSR